MRKLFFHITGQHDIGELIYFLNELRAESKPQNIMVSVEVTAQEPPPSVSRKESHVRSGNVQVLQKV